MMQQPQQGMRYGQNLNMPQMGGGQQAPQQQNFKQQNVQQQGMMQQGTGQQMQRRPQQGMGPQGMQQQAPQQAAPPKPGSPGNPNLPEASAEAKAKLKEGLGFREQRKMQQAIETLREAVKLSNGRPDYLFQLAMTWQMVGNHIQAGKLYTMILENYPNYPDALYNRAQIFVKTHNNPQKAKEDIAKLLRVQPQHASAFWCLGSCEEMMNNVEKAMNAYKRAMQIQPNHHQAEHDLLILRAKSCDWSTRSADQTRITDLVLNHQPTEVGTPPFPCLSLNYFDTTTEIHSKAAKASAEYIYRQIQEQIENNKFEITPKADGEKIKIGYLSPDMRSHAVGRLIKNLFDYHDRDRFEIHAFTLIPTKDDVAMHIKDSVDHYHKVMGKPAVEIAKLINEQGIDVLVEMGGQTTNSKMEVAMFKPAPVIISWLGYLDTSGMEIYDYILTDKKMFSDDLRPHFSEEPLFMERSMFPMAKMDVSEYPPTRRDMELPQDAIVLASFNTVYKIEPDIFDIWMKILREAENTVLWLFEGSGDVVKKNLRQEAENRGVSGDRLVFARMRPHEEHLARLQNNADLYLDTHIYNGGSTLVGVLQLGIPVLSKRGPQMMQHMGESILTEAGFKEGICYTDDEYLRKAVRFAKDEGYRGAIKEAMAAVPWKFGDSPMKDFVGEMESLFTDVYGKWKSSTN